MYFSRLSFSSNATKTGTAPGFIATCRLICNRKVRLVTLHLPQLSYICSN
jgi:hypothetical protein